MVKRWVISTNRNGDAYVAEFEHGHYVKFTDYEQLEKALAEAKSELDRLRNYCTLTFGISHPEIRKCIHQIELANEKGNNQELRDILDLKDGELDESNKLADQIREALTDAYAVNGFGKLKDRIQELEKERDDLKNSVNYFRYEEPEKLRKEYEKEIAELKALVAELTKKMDDTLPYLTIDLQDAQIAALNQANDAMREALKSIQSGAYPCEYGQNPMRWAMDVAEAAIQKAG